MNKIYLVGRLTADPEMSNTASGVPLCRFTVAVTRRFAKENEKTADFFRVTAFNKLADVCAKWLVKGTKVVICGSITIDSYETKAGEKRISVSVIADEVDFVSAQKQEEKSESLPF